MVPPDEAIMVRFNEVDRRLHNVETGKASRRDVDGLSEDVRELKEEVKSLRRALIGFSLTIAGSAVIFALTVVQLIGGGGA